jgi:hypothetical protein
VISMIVSEIGFNFNGEAILVLWCGFGFSLLILPTLSILFQKLWSLCVWILLLGVLLSSPVLSLACGVVVALLSQRGNFILRNSQSVSA